MGTDIEFVVQVRKPCAPWRTIEVPDYCWDVLATRSYIWFGILAGVQNKEVTPISAPRGLPDDWDGGELGYHSQSWVTAAELATYDWAQPSGWGDRTLGDILGIGYWKSWLLGLAENPEDIRLVFGFDS
jgi:hypothetical protein